MFIDLRGTPMRLLNSKRIILLCAAAVILYVAVVSIERPFSAPSVTNTTTHNEATNTKLDEKTVANEISPTSGANSQAPKVESPINESDIIELRKWTSTQYLSVEERKIYWNYSDSVLDELIKQGDVRAVDVKASKMIFEGESEKAKHYLFEASALGSTSALMRLASHISIPVPKPNETKEDVEQSRRAAAVDALAVVKVLEMRGNLQILRAARSSAINHYEFNYGKDSLALTDEEKLSIDQRGQELYDRLQARRNELGLGEFDNSTPKIIKLIDDMIKNK